MLRREFVKFCGVVIPLGLTGKILGEEAIQVKIDPLQQYRQLWEEIVYSIDLRMEYTMSAPNHNLRFRATCSWNETTFKTLKMQIFRYKREGKDTTAFTIYVRSEKPSGDAPRTSYDMVVDEEVLSKEDYQNLKRFTIQAANLTHEQHREVLTYKGEKAVHARLEDIAAQNPVTQEALWRSEHLEEARKELWERQRLQSIESERIWNSSK